MDTHEWREIGSIVADCSTRLFRALGVELDYVGCQEPIPCADELTVAVIGLAGMEMRGSLVVGTTPNLLVLTHPLTKDRSKLDEDQLRDWSGELANQLIGRIKIRLLAHGITISLGTPTTMSGRELTLGSALKNTECLPHRFEVGRDWLLVRMEAVAEPGVKLSKTPVPIPETEEGGMLIF
jgi:CheY-specific phosphatase CheX